MAQSGRLTGPTSRIETGVLVVALLLSVLALALVPVSSMVRWWGLVFFVSFFLTTLADNRIDEIESASKKEYDEIVSIADSILKDIKDSQWKAAVVAKVWDRITQIDNVTIQNFELVIVGIGALFIAYGQTYTSPHLRLAIGFVGLGHL